LIFGSIVNVKKLNFDLSRCFDFDKKSVRKDFMVCGLIVEL